MRRTRNLQEEILKLLKRAGDNGDFLSVNQLTLLLGSHWHTVHNNLILLENEGAVEKLTTSSGYFYKIKKGEE